MPTDQIRLHADRVVDAAVMRGEAQTRRSSCVKPQVPGSSRIEGRALDVHHRAVVGDRSQAVRRPPGDAVVERVDQGAVGADAMDQAGVEVGDEELAARGVEG